MRITRSSDWRSALAFDVPVLAADAMPGDPARCVECGMDAEPRPRTELWAVKHRHPHDPAGTVRLYCAEHTPRPAAAVAVSVRPASGRAARPHVERKPSTRTPPRPERVAAVCPTCFVEVPPTGVCGICGERVG